MSDRVYCYPPDFRVLRNRFDIRTQADLDATEREFVTQRLREPVPTGGFDLAHLQAIHRHLFQDIYDWAGALRTVEIEKGGDRFQFRRYIETGMADVHRRLMAQDFLRDLPSADFAREAGEILGDVNYVHPFREGNGRTQLQYLKQLAIQAGHPIDLTRLSRESWRAASREAHAGRYHEMADCIGQAIIGERAQDQERRRNRDRRDR